MMDVHKDIEAFYPLSPMQQGMLFHTLYAPEGGMYVEQTCCTLRGRLNVEAFEKAWQRVVERHPIMRTGFIHDGLKEPVQVVHRLARIKLVHQDWRGLSPSEQEEKLKGFLRDLQKRGFDLARPPLMDLTLLRIGENAFTLIWTYHHVLLDGWSNPILLQEVLALYDAFCRGADASLLPARPYRDYIVWLKRQDLKQAESFWRSNLKGFTAPSPLPEGRPGESAWDPQESYQECEILISQEMTEALRSTARRKSLTMSTCIHGAWALLLSRYSGEEDVVFGSTVSGRPPSLEGSDSMIGLFINTLPVRANTDSGLSTAEWLLELQKNLARIRQYEYCPLTRIQGWSRVPKGTPLFESILVFENYPMNVLLHSTSEDLVIDDLRSFEKTNYPLTVVAGLSDRLSLKILYDRRRFGPESIRGILRHLEFLLKEMGNRPESPVHALGMLTGEEEHRLLKGWNATGSAYPADRCVHALFEEKAQEQPDAVAIGFQNGALTYGELNSRANRLAHFLRHEGIGPDALVGICMERSPEMAVAELGVLKSGGAYVLMDPSYPPERVSFMIEDSGVGTVLAQEKFRQMASEYQVAGCGLRVESSMLGDQNTTHDPRPATLHILCLDTDWPLIAQESDENPEVDVTPGNLAYVIYTSGSTGRPKGVLVEHRGLTNLVSWHHKAFELSKADRGTRVASPGFDAAIWEIWPCLTRGAGVYIPDEEIRSSPPALADYLLSMGITITFLPTPLAEEVLKLKMDWWKDSALRMLLTGGDRLNQTPSAPLPFSLVNNYGPTEVTVVTTSGPVTSGRNPGRPPSIGRPIHNTQVYLLDRRLRCVPVGASGELYAGGDGVARGYLKRPELTAECFVPHPFSTERGKRLYRTGDLSRYLPDGDIEFLGRIDHQVKIRGFRIELGEIEAALIDHPAVRHAAVVDLGDTPADRRLVAYVVPDQIDAPSGPEWREFLMRTLPEYMIPSSFVILETMPLNPNGKVDRKALPAPDPSLHGSERGYVAPRTPVEEILASIWSQVLGVERIGIHDSFFDLGGHSLLATQVVSRIRETLGIELPLRTLFEQPTLAEQASGIDQARLRLQGISKPSIPAAPRDKDLPLSYSQQRLWFLDQLEPGGHTYNLPVAARLSGPFSLEILQQSLDAVVRRHDVLRTLFAAREGKAFQKVSAGVDVSIPVHDFRHLPEAEREGRALLAVNREARIPFDLSQGPLLRPGLFRLSDHEHVFLLNMHHIISDGWSLGILMEEIAAAYRAFSFGEPLRLPPLQIQYADYACWQRRWLQGEVLDTQLDYWKQELAGLPPLLELPTDRPRPKTESYQGGTWSFELPGRLYRELRTLSRKERVTLFMTLLAGFQTLLYRYTGQEDIAVGTPIANRTHYQVEGLIGFFVNTLVMRTRFSRELSFRELLARVRQTALGAYAHQDVPFEMLVDRLRPGRSTSHSPLIQVMFVYQNVPRRALKMSTDLTLDPVEVDTGAAKFDLTLVVTEDGERLIGSLEYNDQLFRRQTIERMGSCLVTLLAGLAEHPEQPVSGIGWLPEDEKHRLLAEWNDTAVCNPSDRPVHRLLEEEAGRNPDATSVKFLDRHLSYGELNRRANQLAHYLKRKMIGAESVVGICMERSLEMMVGLMGILKAGAAYLPLDPSYPPERLSFMAEDSGLGIILTQEKLRTKCSELCVAGCELKNEGSEFNVQDHPELATPNSEHPDNPRHATRDVLCLDTEWPVIARESEENPVVHVSPDHLAYVIYTSGSTGRPKGTMIQHRGVSNLTHGLMDLFDIKAGSHVLQFASIGFDASVTEFFPTLGAGGILFLAPREVLFSAQDLMDLIREEGIEIVTLPPSLLSVLPAEGIPMLRVVISAGEACSWDIVSKWAPGKRFLNGYGPTEVTVSASFYRAEDDRSKEITGVPVGRANPNTRIYLLSESLGLAPAGGIGEIHVGGVGLARGYLNRPDLTAGRFIPNPFGTEAGARMYGTGDLARYLPDGNMEFVGRIDDQVKIRGFRIELGEVEAAINDHPSVRQAAVVACGEDAAQRRLAAYVVLNQEEKPSPAHWREFLNRSLPDYMIPSAFVIMESLPLTPSGKVDRKNLPIPRWDRPETGTEYVPPRTRTEEELTKIWSLFLGVEKIGIYDNFFELGGDSILSIQVLAKANHLGLALSPRQFFQNPTVAGLASLAGKGPPAAEAEQGPVVGRVLLTPIQQWFFENHPLEPNHFNTSLFFEVPSLDVLQVGRTARRLMTHHDALRMRFTSTPSGWMQIDEGTDQEVPFSRIDLSALMPEEHRSALESGAAALQASLNVSLGPLFRMIYFDLGQARTHRLFMTFHHLVVDGVSLRILAQDFLELYQQYAGSEGGAAVRLPAKTTSFRHWAEQLKAYAQFPEVEQDLPYWLEIGEEAVRPIPLDSQAGPNTYGTTQHVTLSLGAELTDALLHRVPKVYDTEINDILLTALARTFSAWTGERKLLIELEGHGREPVLEGVDVSRTVGWFTSAFPVLLDLEKVRGEHEEIMAIRRQLRRLPKRGLSYGLLRYSNDHIEIREKLLRMPKPEVNFNYLGQFDRIDLSGLHPESGPGAPNHRADWALAGLAQEHPGPEQDPNGTRSALLDIVATVSGNELHTRWLYGRMLHLRSTIEALAETYRKELSRLIDFCLRQSTHSENP